MTKRPTGNPYAHLIAARYGFAQESVEQSAGDIHPTVETLLNRCTCRRYRDEAVPEQLLETLLACAQSAPTKSNLQQYSIIHIEDPAQRDQLASHCPKTEELRTCPVFLVFCADLRRNQRIAEFREHIFANDHMDGLINGTIDAAMAMQCFITAAEAVGVGCAAISEIRDNIGAVSQILALPEGVFPIAGLTAGWPSEAGYINQRLDPEIVVHKNRYDEADLARQIDEYDRRRHAIFAIPPGRQIQTEKYGVADYYPWSENVARQLSIEERPDLSAFLLSQGFKVR